MCKPVLIPALVALGLACAQPDSARPWGEYWNVEGPYLHEPSGIALPSSVAGFSRCGMFDSDMGKGAVTAHFTMRACDGASSKISLTIRPPASSKASLNAELARSLKRYRGLEARRSPQRTDLSVCGNTRPAMEARLSVNGGYPNRIEIIAVPLDSWVLEGRLYHRSGEREKYWSAFAQLLESACSETAAQQAAAPDRATLGRNGPW